MTYILLDESGDLGFKFKRGSSRYFVMTAIVTDNKKSLEKVARKVHRSLSKKYRKINALHAYQQELITRRRLLIQLNKVQCKIITIIIDKSTLSKFTQDKFHFYNYLTGVLIDRLVAETKLSSGNFILIASRRETSTFLNIEFRKYLARHLHVRHGIDLTIKISQPSDEKSLQVVDFASWAIYHKYENKDDRFYKLIESLITDYSPINDKASPA